jgi:hypothetical protein
MKFVVGTVTSNADASRSGLLEVRFPKIFDGNPQKVTYTSPYCKINSGGFIAIPEKDDQILALYNEDLIPGESLFYYHSTILRDREFVGDEKPNPNFKPLRSSDPKAQIYNKDNKPATQTFTNPVGAGLYIQRDFSDSSISNNVTLKAESGDEINLGPLGFQVRNPQGDSIILTGSNPNDGYAAQSFSVETESNQEYKCTSSDITMKIIDGGDINIINDSTGNVGLQGIGGPWSGNIRLKSKYRNIDLAALGEGSHVNIITQGATIQVDSLGKVTISSGGDIQLQSAENVNINATKRVNIFGGEGVQVGSTGTVELNASPFVSVNGNAVEFLPTSPSKDDIAKFISATPGFPVGLPTIVPNDYYDPVGVGPGGVQI